MNKIIYKVKPHEVGFTLPGK